MDELNLLISNHFCVVANMRHYTNNFAGSLRQYAQLTVILVIIDQWFISFNSNVIVDNVVPDHSKM